MSSLSCFLQGKKVKKMISDMGKVSEDLEEINERARRALVAEMEVRKSRAKDEVGS